MLSFNFIKSFFYSLFISFELYKNPSIYFSLASNFCFRSLSYYHQFCSYRNSYDSPSTFISKSSFILQQILFLWNLVYRNYPFKISKSTIQLGPIFPQSARLSVTSHYPFLTLRQNQHNSNFIGIYSRSNLYLDLSPKIFTSTPSKNIISFILWSCSYLNLAACLIAVA